MNSQKSEESFEMEQNEYKIMTNAVYHSTD